MDWYFKFICFVDIIDSIELYFFKQIYLFYIPSSKLEYFSSADVRKVERNYWTKFKK